MVQSQYSLKWEAYKSNICGGFSALQQNGEMVDMTLAADGHFVKVHQVLMALVSPYLKELITSAPCQHPVIFLNNVSYKTLTSILEYVYTGEVLLPSECLTEFVETARALHIQGLEDLASSNKMSFKMVDNAPEFEDNLCTVTGTKRLSLPNANKTGLDEISLPAAARRIIVKQEKQSRPAKRSRENLREVQIDFSDAMDDTGPQDDDEYPSPDDSVHVDSSFAASKETSSSNVQYSVSIRGALQVILNRYMYNIHSNRYRAGLRRWRCVDYRSHKCPAFLVTKGNVVLNRANLHNHAFHDKKILQKVEKGAVYSAITDIKEYKEAETDLDTTQE